MYVLKHNTVSAITGTTLDAVETRMSVALFFSRLGEIYSTSHIRRANDAITTKVVQDQPRNDDVKNA